VRVNRSAATVSFPLTTANDARSGSWLIRIAGTSEATVQQTANFI
jgi:hypothetical protein